jgi:hypothetical protein
VNIGDHNQDPTVVDPASNPTFATDHASGGLRCAVIRINSGRPEDDPCFCFRTRRELTKSGGSKAAAKFDPMAAERIILPYVAEMSHNRHR